MGYSSPRLTNSRYRKEGRSQIPRLGFSRGDAENGMVAFGATRQLKGGGIRGSGTPAASRSADTTKRVSRFSVRKWNGGHSPVARRLSRVHIFSASRLIWRVAPNRLRLTVGGGNGKIRFIHQRIVL